VPRAQSRSFPKKKPRSSQCPAQGTAEEQGRNSGGKWHKWGDDYLSSRINCSGLVHGMVILASASERTPRCRCLSRLQGLCIARNSAQLMAFNGAAAGAHHGPRCTQPPTPGRLILTIRIQTKSKQRLGHSQGLPLVPRCGVGGNLILSLGKKRKGEYR